MPAAIEVILQHDVDNVGVSGDLVRVRPGFARNFLIPRQLALPATAANKSRIGHQRAVALARAEKVKKEYTEAAAKLSALTVKIVQRVGEDGRLFGSVTSKDIEAAVAALGEKIDRKRIQLPEPIKALGDFEVPVRFTAEISATLKVNVVSK
jgi:large subunit ribosomal protein L9